MLDPAGARNRRTDDSFIYMASCCSKRVAGTRRIPVGRKASRRSLSVPPFRSLWPLASAKEHREVHSAAQGHREAPE